MVIMVIIAVFAFVSFFKGMKERNLEEQLSWGNNMLNKLREVFTEEYKKETNYREEASKMLYKFKLKDASESVEDKVKRLTNRGFNSDFKVDTVCY